METDQLVIFGFNGDLSRRKLMPALARLEQDRQLSEKLVINVVTRKATDIDQYFEGISEHIPDHIGEATINSLKDRIHVIVADIATPEAFSDIKTHIEKDNPLTSCTSIMFYFAIPPSLFESTIDNMVTAGLHQCAAGTAENRLLIEKPFGHDLESAHKLIKKIEQHFGEESVYRIDHYLAKDTVQNILHFRFHNPMFQQLWNSRHIDFIQISALEEIDIQGRASFYEQTGTIRDMVQGHLLQLLAITTMDEPSSIDAQQVRRQRQRLLDAVRPISLDATDKPEAVRAQYEGYRTEVGNQASVIETFAALRLQIESSRWRDVPIYLRAGKAMHRKATEIHIGFKRSPHHHERNVLTFRIQPQEGIVVKVATKEPGLNATTKSVDLDYCMEEAGLELADAYEKILFDALKGDQTLFPTSSEILSSWRAVDHVLTAWHDTQPDTELPNYKKGSVTVDVQDSVLIKDSHAWISTDKWTC